jgi:hypothetical protein
VLHVLFVSRLGDLFILTLDGHHRNPEPIVGYLRALGSHLHRHPGEAEPSYASRLAQRLSSVASHSELKDICHPPEPRP